MEEGKSSNFNKAMKRYDGVKVNLEVKQKHTSSKKRKVKTWTPQQDDELIKLYQQYPKKWAKIASLMTDRNENQCLHRYRRISQFGTNRKIWSTQQDQTIKKLIKKVGKNWKALSEMLGTKTGKQIRERFINKLDPKIIKQQWSDEQDRKIIQLYTQIGRKWSQISKFLPGRPQNKIKNRFYSYIQKNYDIKFRLLDENGEPKTKKQANKQNIPLTKRSLKDITNKISQQPTKQLNKNQQKNAFFCFPSIGNIVLDMKLQDCPFYNDKKSKIQIGSLIKIDQQWPIKEKDEIFEQQMDLHNDIFFFNSQ